MIERPACPECGTTGRRVKPTTLAALVEKDALDRMESHDDFHFCPGVGCSVAYYDASGQRIGTDAVDVSIGVKRAEAPRPLCYCFGHSAEDITADALDNGRSTIAEDIASKCQQGLDRCELENPRGVCCLCDVREAAKRALASTDEPNDTAAGRSDPGCEVTQPSGGHDNHMA